MSQLGAENNLKWLETKIKFEFVKADIRHESAINNVLKATQPDAIWHLAAQVAVTTSVVNRREDFEINAHELDRSRTTNSVAKKDNFRNMNFRNFRLG